ncbi:uncharacterized protein BT62DRAFT_994917 [Guyanagaster necrorhizus]|uniref:Uncharacterized protein n=1 Tax=Guyanagaster necrorhizus TaxID=856835 RepID=A0A9P7VRN1_9AGAR|nr:uncharacterized protein BT62DRAFT_994917 [Guyanagaster necrorhizus MCA 3950]KAG7445465.1 hypothetical protein BT62DRAFT_994917 [Guyanagaster necrorhizus MCA 3950]
MTDSLRLPNVEYLTLKTHSSAQPYSSSDIFSMNMIEPSQFSLWSLSLNFPLCLYSISAMSSNLAQLSITVENWAACDTFISLRVRKDGGDLVPNPIELCITDVTSKCGGQSFTHETFGPLIESRWNTERLRRFEMHAWYGWGDPYYSEVVRRTLGKHWQTEELEDIISQCKRSPGIRKPTSSSGSLIPPTVSQTRTFRYLTHDTSDIRQPVLCIHKWFLNLQGGDAVRRKNFLAKEEWLFKPSLLRMSARCSGCLGVINFEEDYDVNAWTRHRDSCKGIEERMMIAVSKELEFPAGDMDEYDSDDAFYGPDDGWEPVKQSVPDEKWHMLKEILALLEKSAEEAEENGSKTVTFIEIEDGEDVEEDVDDTDGSCIRCENEAYSEGKGSSSGHDFSVPAAGPA